MSISMAVADGLGIEQTHRCICALTFLARASYSVNAIGGRSISVDPRTVLSVRLFRDRPPHAVTG